MRSSSAPTRRFDRSHAAAFLLGLAFASPLAAQFAQYTPPGGGSSEPELRKDALAKAVEDSRYRLGPVRIDPWIGIHDVGLIDVPEAPGAKRHGAQLVGNAGAGLRLYLPLGAKVFLAAHVLPEYSWAENRDRNRLNGRFGFGVFSFWNRLTVEALATREDALGVATPQLLSQVNQRRDRASLSAELQVAGSLYVFAETENEKAESLAETGQDPEGATLAQVDRTETKSRAGVRLRTPRGWRLGAGVEHTETDFAGRALDRSSSGTAPVVEVASPPDGNLQATASLAYRSLDPAAGSSFVSFSGVTGSVSLGLGPGYRFAPTVYASRNVIYTLSPPYSYFRSDRTGLSLTARLLRRLELSGFGEAGRDRYVGSGTVDVTEDETAYGIQAQLLLSRRLVLTLGWSEERYDSPRPGGDRKLSVARAGLALSRGRSPWF
ncbi:MAG TPA: hypothetical protein PK413_00680 [Thermoanaerobaculia bacterium]|nr:hypothetical protein [Thermoanaerobaculia bacterium]